MQLEDVEQCIQMVLTQPTQRSKTWSCVLYEWSNMIICDIWGFTEWSARSSTYNEFH